MPSPPEVAITSRPLIVAVTGVVNPVPPWAIAADIRPSNTSASCSLPARPTHNVMCSFPDSYSARYPSITPTSLPCKLVICAIACSPVNTLNRFMSPIWDGAASAGSATVLRRLSQDPRTMPATSVTWTQKNGRLCQGRRCRGVCGADAPFEAVSVPSTPMAKNAFSPYRRSRGRSCPRLQVSLRTSGKTLLHLRRPAAKQSPASQKAVWRTPAWKVWVQLVLALVVTPTPSSWLAPWPPCETVPRGQRRAPVSALTPQNRLQTLPMLPH